MINLKNSDKKISNHLQQDVVKISGKTIFINPFLYWRRFDENTNRWLREPGQMSEEQILKTLELISTFHPDLNSGQLLEVERKMAITKKIPFEKWVTKSFAKKARLLENEKRKFQRERFFSGWKEWLSLENTQQALLPLIVAIFLSSFIGWSLGISKNSCNPYFEQNLEQVN